MKKDIEHVVTSSAMFLIAFIVSSGVQPVKVAARRRGPGASSLIWFVGVALVSGALVWTMNVYAAHVAFCAHLRVQALAFPLRSPISPSRPSLEYVDLSALGIEAVLLTALIFFAIRTMRRRTSRRGTASAKAARVRDPLK